MPNKRILVYGPAMKWLGGDDPQPNTHAGSAWDYWYAACLAESGYDVTLAVRSYPGVALPGIHRAKTRFGYLPSMRMICRERIDVSQYDVLFVINDGTWNRFEGGLDKQFADQLVLHPCVCAVITRVVPDQSDWQYLPKSRFVSVFTRRDVPNAINCWNYDREKIVVVGWGLTPSIPLPEETENPYFDDGRPKVVWNGVLRHHAIDFINKLAVRLPGADFHIFAQQIFGENMEMLYDLKPWLPIEEQISAGEVKQLFPAPNIIWHGRCWWGSYWGYIAHADAGLDFIQQLNIENTWENCKLHEYLGLGCPTITEEQVPHHLIGRTGCGAVAKDNDIDDYTRRLEQMLSTEYPRSQAVEYMWANEQWKHKVAIWEQFLKERSIL